MRECRSGWRHNAFCTTSSAYEKHASLNQNLLSHVIVFVTKRYNLLAASLGITLQHVLLLHIWDSLVTIDHLTSCTIHPLFLQLVTVLPILQLLLIQAAATNGFRTTERDVARAVENYNSVH